MKYKICLRDTKSPRNFEKCLQILILVEIKNLHLLFKIFCSIVTFN